MRRILLALCCAMVAAACGEERPTLPTTGLHVQCPAAGCAEGQTCVTAGSPRGELSTCEIRCDADADCPEPLVCNLPPVVPDSIPNVCVER